MPRASGIASGKHFYRIGEVAGLVGVEPYVLRYWESVFPTIRPKKSRSGRRMYSQSDVEKFLRVKELLYAQRFTIAGARRQLREPPSDSTAAGLGAALGQPPSPETTGARTAGNGSEFGLLADPHPSDECRPVSLVGSGVNPLQDGGSAILNSEDRQHLGGPAGDAANSAVGTSTLAVVQENLLAIRRQIVGFLNALDVGSGDSVS